jgi:hypothetical protein
VRKLIEEDKALTNQLTQIEVCYENKLRLIPEQENLKKYVSLPCYRKELAGLLPSTNEISVSEPKVILNYLFHITKMRNKVTNRNSTDCGVENERQMVIASLKEESFDFDNFKMCEKRLPVIYIDESKIFSPEILYINSKIKLLQSDILNSERNLLKENSEKTVLLENIRKIDFKKKEFQVKSFELSKKINDIISNNY